MTSTLWLLAFVLGLITLGCAVVPPQRAGEGAPSLPDWKTLWDFNDPAASEKRFEERLALVRGTAEPDAVVILLSQLARSRGLQRRFDEAHRTLDEAERLLGNRRGEARVRVLLERGRARNSAGEEGRGRAEFLAALEVAQASGLDGLVVDAMHMMGIIAPSGESLDWNDRAIAFAGASADAAARNWLGTLLNNQGWTRHDRGEYGIALDLFRRALAWREERGGEREILIARWAVARCLRSLGQVAEALAVQEVLAAEWAKAGEPDGYVEEERGECLLLLGREEEARPRFRRAHGILSADPWLRDREPERLARLARLGGVEEEPADGGNPPRD